MTIVGHINGKPMTKKQLVAFRKKNDNDEPVFDEDQGITYKKSNEKSSGKKYSGAGFNWNGIADNGDGTFTTTDKRARTRLLKEFHRQGLKVRSRKQADGSYLIQSAGVKPFRSTRARAASPIRASPPPRPMPQHRRAPYPGRRDPPRMPRRYVPPPNLGGSSSSPGFGFKIPKPGPFIGNYLKKRKEEEIIYKQQMAKWEREKEENDRKKDLKYRKQKEEAAIRDRQRAADLLVQQERKRQLRERQSRSNFASAGAGISSMERQNPPSNTSSYKSPTPPSNYGIRGTAARAQGVRMTSSPSLAERPVQKTSSPPLADVREARKEYIEGS